MRPAHADRYDLAVIGAGAAGLSVAYGATRLGLRVVLIERGEMGGECLNTGCIPSKVLLHAARQGASWLQAQARIRQVIAAIAPADSAARYAGLGATVRHGAARFTGRHELEVNGQTLWARRIVIATGAASKIPAFVAGMPYLTSQTIWDLPACPAHLVILGAGPMGCELAEAFAGLGAKVTLIGPMLPREDAELVAILGAHLRARGVNLLAPRAVAAAPGIGVLLADGNTVTGSHLLIAAGRRAETTALNLAAAGIQAGPDGIRTDAGLRALGTRHIYAAGDCADPAGIGPQRFTHVAGSHAGIVLRRALFRLPAKLNPAPPVRAVFTAPELAQVGFTAAEAGPGGRALTGRFADNDRAVADDDITGMVKLVLDRRGRLIGAGIVGRHAGEMIGLYALAIASRTRLSALAGLVLPYPTLSESGKRAIGGYLGERLFSKGPRFVAKWLGRLP